MRGSVFPSEAPCHGTYDLCREHSPAEVTEGERMVTMPLSGAIRHQEEEEEEEDDKISCSSNNDKKEIVKFAKMSLQTKPTYLDLRVRKISRNIYVIN